MIRSALAGSLVAGVLAMPVVSSAAFLSISLEPVSPTVRAGFPVAVDVWLRGYSGPAGLQAGAIDLDFGGISTEGTGLRFRAGPGSPNGFQPDAALSSILSDPLDGSLLDGYAEGFGDLSYVVDYEAESGLALSTGDVRLGRLWVLAPSEGQYTFDASFEGTAIYDLDGEPLDLAVTPATILVQSLVVPEPIWGLALIATLTALWRRTIKSN